MKYMGSKSRIAKYIVPIIQKCINDNNITTYIEPFVGGSNIIEHIVCENKFGYDSNDYLIEFWKAIQSGWNPFDEIKMTKEFYDSVKSNKDSYPKEVVALVGLCATYNAKWFGGYAGQVTTKIGTIRNYYEEAVRNVLKQSSKLKDVKYKKCNFEDLEVIKESMIYCDPPYQGTTSYKDIFNHNTYWDKVRELSNSNFVICSEYNAPLDFICIWEKEISNTLNKNNHTKSVERLFTYKEGKFYYV